MKKTITKRMQSQKETYGKLENCRQHMEACVNELEDSLQSSSFKGRDDRAVWFKQVFNFYIEYLIPALQETLLLDRKHLELVRLNPDKAFKPVKMEVRHHQKLVNQFFHRFEQIVNDFNNLLDKQNNKRRA